MKTDKQVPAQGSIPARIVSLMTAQGITEAELARRTQIPQATLHKILAGKTSDPRASTLKTLAEYFSVSVDAIIGCCHIIHHEVREPEASYADDKAQLAYRIPLISWDIALKTPEFTDKLSAQDWQEWVMVEFMPQGLYALSSKTSMTARFPKGSILIVDSNAKPSDGDALIVHYPDTDEATLREFLSDEPQQFLRPYGRPGDCHPLSADIQLLGSVIQSQYRFT